MQVAPPLLSTATPTVRRGSHPPAHVLPLLPQHPPPSFPAHPARPPPTPVNDSPALPFVPILPPQISHLRSHLKRRRSSYPPGANSTPPANDFPWLFGGTPLGLSTAVLGDQLLHPGFGQDLAVTFQPGESNNWGGLLDFTSEPPHSTLASEPAFRDAPAATSRPTSSSGPKRRFRMLYRGNEIEPARLVQIGSDLAWKTILGSMVEVDGVGQVGVARILSEIWKRGGGETVTAQFLWPNILETFLNSFNGAGPSKRIAPSTQAALALQDLYNMTLRPWESSIFSGLLASFGDLASPPQMPDVSSQLFGATIGELATSSLPHPPSPEVDPSLFDSSIFDTDALFSLSDAPHFTEPANSAKKATAKSVSGIGEILSAMSGVHSETPAPTPRLATQRKIARRFQETLQMPTPETDESQTPDAVEVHRRANTSDSAGEVFRLTPAESAESPFATASSSASNASRLLSAPSSKASSSDLVGKVSPGRAAHPTLLAMPDAAFIPPPPMCMFFSPAFKDLQQGKVGVWKGQLDIRGVGGGRFSVLIVGEDSTGHLWQSHTWPTTITYPQEPQPVNPNAAGSCTSTMIPVSHLAREGFTPAAMGMVLCDDEKIQEYVSMVQGLHAEGVAFHLHNAGHLPLVFLPAKFDSSDQLQRLGVAFMTKPGVPLPAARPATAAGKITGEGRSSTEASRKKRRQSAPAKIIEPYRKRRGASVTKGVILEEVAGEADG